MLATAEMETFTEKLLDEIKQFPVLYDRKYSRCKDGGAEKEEAWELLTNRMPKDLNISVAETKKRWRTLKDCYAKYLRSGWTTNRFEKRYKSWRWARHMSYFKNHMPNSDSEKTPIKKSHKDPCNDKRTTAYRNRMLNERLDREKEEQKRKSREHNESINASKEKLTMEIVKPEKETVTTTIDEDNDPYQTITYALSDYEDTQDQAEMETTIEANVTSTSPKRTFSIENHTNQSLSDPLMGGNFDGLDLTFLGYASSVKKLSQRRQTVIKFTVAKLIMQQEMAEQNEEELKDNAHRTTKSRSGIEIV